MLTFCVHTTKMDVFVVTTSGSERVEETVAALRRDLPDCRDRVRLVVDDAPPGASYLETDRRIHANHRRALEGYVAQRSRRAPNVLVVEDDCRFCEEGAGATMAGILGALRGTDWWTVHVGHIALGPVWPSRRHPRLVHSLVPATAHAIVYNGDHVEEFLRRLPVFKRPWGPEGLMSVPARAKYAVWPAMATQAVAPKELRLLLGARLGTARTFTVMQDATTLFVGLVVPLLIAALVFDASHRRRAFWHP